MYYSWETATSPELCEKGQVPSHLHERAAEASRFKEMNSDPKRNTTSRAKGNFLRYQSEFLVLECSELYSSPWRVIRLRKSGICFKDDTSALIFFINHNNFLNNSLYAYCLMQKLIS